MQNIANSKNSDHVGHRTLVLERDTVELQSLVHSSIVLSGLMQRMRQDNPNEPNVHRIEITTAELDLLFGRAEDEADYRLADVRARLG